MTSSFFTGDEEYVTLTEKYKPVDPISEVARDAADNYVASLQDRGYVQIEVLRYRVALNNYEPHDKRYDVGFGYAVRYTSGACDDHLRSPRTGERFHEQSLTVFAHRYGISQEKLISSGGILADFGGVSVTPYYVAAWSPASGPNMPEVPTVILKRMTVHTPGDRNPVMPGPRQMFCVLMETA